MAPLHVTKVKLPKILMTEQAVLVNQNSTNLIRQTFTKNKIIICRTFMNVICDHVNNKCQNSFLSTQAFPVKQDTKQDYRRTQLYKHQ